MNAFSHDIALTGIAAIPASHATPIAARHEQDIAARRAARATLFQDCLETGLSSLVLLGCLLFAAAALRLAVAPCPLRHWGVLSIYAIAATLTAFTLLAIARQVLHFKKSFG